MGTDFVTKIVEKTIGPAFAGAAAGGWYGGLESGGLVGAGAGLVIGVVAHAGATFYDLRKTEENSPYRFLTTLETRGVLVRSGV